MSHYAVNLSSKKQGDSHKNWARWSLYRDATSKNASVSLLVLMQPVPAIVLLCFSSIALQGSYVPVPRLWASLMSETWSVSGSYRRKKEGTFDLVAFEVWQMWLCLGSTYGPGLWDQQRVPRGRSVERWTSQSQPCSFGSLCSPESSWCQLPFAGFPPANGYKYSHISHILYLCFRKCLRCIRNRGDIIIIFRNWPNSVKYKMTDGTTQYWCGVLRLNHNWGLKIFPFGTGRWWECKCWGIGVGCLPFFILLKLILRIMELWCCPCLETPRPALLSHQMAGISVFLVDIWIAEMWVANSLWVRDYLPAG